ncbi:hypothetical protein [Agrobacterium rosae]|uniref:hypothetical protein n=1 Tax=Agrobacterium rosae TaxID=1972867 RepID=UPI003BA28793
MGIIYQHVRGEPLLPASLTDHSDRHPKCGLSHARNTAEKMPASDVHRRIIEACLRIARRQDAAEHATVQALLQRAVDNCLAQDGPSSVSRHYRLFLWRALQEGLNTMVLPSETTFRRCVKTARRRLLDAS